MFKTPYQKHLEAEKERILQLKRERSVLIDISINETIEAISIEKDKVEDFKKRYLDFAWFIIEGYNDKIKKINLELESRY